MYIFQNSLLERGTLLRVHTFFKIDKCVVFFTWLILSHKVVGQSCNVCILNICHTGTELGRIFSKCQSLKWVVTCLESDHVLYIMWLDTYHKDKTHRGWIPTLKAVKHTCAKVRKRRSIKYTTLSKYVFMHKQII